MTEIILNDEDGFEIDRSVKELTYQCPDCGRGFFVGVEWKEDSVVLRLKSYFDPLMVSLVDIHGG